jgi:hydrogenase nickel incorporation protein HypA/HybF
MTRALIMSLTEWVGQQEVRRPIARVRLAVGEFTCVEPDLLRSSFAKQRRGTPLEGAELVVRDVAFVAYCRGCDREYRPEIGREYACPECGRALHDIRSGRELKIECVEFAPEDFACAAGASVPLDLIAASPRAGEQAADQGEMHVRG